MNKGLLALMVIIAGMAGLYFKVEYSGWVLFIGLLAVESAC